MREVTVEDGLDVLVIVPPLSLVQSPVQGAGLLPASVTVVVVSQID